MRALGRIHAGDEDVRVVQSGRGRLRYLADPTPPSEAVREDFDAAIGFIDVSGFTALSEKLAKEAGDAGAELLNLCANPPPLLRSRSPPG